jgi:hypothetical protein
MPKLGDEVTGQDLWTYLKLYPSYSLLSIRYALIAIKKEKGRDVSLSQAEVDRYLRPYNNGGLGYGRQIDRIRWFRTTAGSYWSINPTGDPYQTKYTIAQYVKDGPWYATYYVPSKTAEDTSLSVTLGEHNSLNAAKLACARHEEVLLARGNNINIPSQYEIYVKIWRNNEDFLWAKRKGHGYFEPSTIGDAETLMNSFVPEDDASYRIEIWVDSKVWNSREIKMEVC